MDEGGTALEAGLGDLGESGLPIFRGAGGLWRTHRVEQLAAGLPTRAAIATLMACGGSCGMP